MLKNRIAHLQPDYVLVIVARPTKWHPARVDDVPPGSEILSRHFVASYEEALDDRTRCNKLSLDHGLNTWAVIQCPASEI